MLPVFDDCLGLRQGQPGDQNSVVPKTEDLTLHTADCKVGTVSLVGPSMAVNSPGLVPQLDLANPRILAEQLLQARCFSWVP